MSARVPQPREPGRALGSNPFEEQVDRDPLAEALEALGTPGPGRRGARPAPAFAPPPAGPVAEPTPLERRRPAAPRLEEIELPEPEDWIDRWLGPDLRRRLAALGHLVEGEVPYDRFGMAPETARRAFPIFHALYRFWFRVRSEGWEHLPSHGPVVLASNHGGLLPFDGAMLVVDALLHTDPPRLARAVVDRWAGELPWVNVFYARVGQVVGTRTNVADLLGDDQMVLVFPEGMEGIRKPVTHRHRVQGFRVGFVEEALRAGAPIVPVGVVGPEDQSPILFDAKPLARRLGLPFFPVTPTFPWLGPLGLLPYPVPYRIRYGEPLRFHERFGPEDADDARLVQYLARQVRREVQHLVDREAGA